MFDLTTAVVIVPSHEVQAIAVPLLRQHSPASLIRVRPHITVLFPFVPFGQLDKACDTLRDLGRRIAPFEVTLAGYGRFPGVIYMKPVDPEPIRAVYRCIRERFPDCLPYEGKFGDTIEPHMTVANFDHEDGRSVMLPPAYAPVTFPVDRLHLWYGARDMDLPWLTYEVIPLCG